MSPDVATPCPQCGAPADEAYQYCEDCGFELKPGAARLQPPIVPGVAGMGAIGVTRAQPGAEVGGVDGASIQFDAAALPPGPPRRPGVVVRDVDLTLVPASCRLCSGRIASDGYCEQCGAPATRPRDHWAEQPAPWVSMVCDRGLRHAINQDGAAVGAAPEPGSFAAMVICDGVSSAARSELASLAAARAARDVLVAPREAAAAPDRAVPSRSAALATAHTVTAAEATAEPDALAVTVATVPPDRPLGSSSVHSKSALLASAMRAAGAAAQEQAVAAASDPPEHNPPACTFVAAVIEGPVLVVGWVGDSRAYWLPDAGTPLQLGADDSWAGEAMALGYSREEAERAPQAHSITRWLGRDAPDPVPRTVARRLEAPGWVMLCSDGLWNYCSEASSMHDLLLATVSRLGQDGAVLAAALVAWANEQGGHDNISVALARIG